MSRPATIPRYVQIAEDTMLDLFGVDLWAMRAEDRNAVIVAACDADQDGRPEDGDSYVGAAVYEHWHDVRNARKRHVGVDL